MFPDSLCEVGVVAMVGSVGSDMEKTHPTPHQSIAQSLG